MPWSGFQTGLWQKEINVRDFIQQNYTPYDGGADFLKPATARTDMFAETFGRQLLIRGETPS